MTKSPSRKKRRGRVPLTFEGVLRHEIGHAWQSKFEELSGLRVADLFVEAKETTGNNNNSLTSYSGESAEEFFAESFAAYTHPHFLDSNVEIYPPLLAAFERLIPRRRG